MPVTTTSRSDISSPLPRAGTDRRRRRFDRSKQVGGRPRRATRAPERPNGRRCAATVRCPNISCPRDRRRSTLADRCPSVANARRAAGADAGGAAAQQVALPSASTSIERNPRQIRLEPSRGRPATTRSTRTTSTSYASARRRGGGDGAGGHVAFLEQDAAPRLTKADHPPRRPPTRPLRCPDAPVAQLAEATASKSVRCGFESHPGHAAAHPGRSVRRRVYDSWRRWYW